MSQHTCLRLLRNGNTAEARKLRGPLPRDCLHTCLINIFTSFVFPCSLNIPLYLGLLLIDNNKKYLGLQKS